MAKAFIIADGCGLSASSDEAILSAAEKGFISGISISVTSERFKSLVPRLKSIPSCLLGIHLNLTEGRPLSSLRKVSSLIDDRGFFSTHGENISVVLSSLSQKAESDSSLTYTHNVDVAVLSAGLGVAIGLNRQEVEKLGMGTMLHDIGKTSISPLILNKQGSLDDYEYRMMKEHVTEGEKILRNHKEIPQEAYDAVLQHHEKLSGRGYPYRLSGNEIKLFGRITGIADCYDALTTRRPYKCALTPYNALEIMSREKKDYDPELLIEFVKIIGKVNRDRPNGLRSC